jgi:hypothetical protein
MIVEPLFILLLLRYEMERGREGEGWKDGGRVHSI